jgi:hypothetical protein
MCLDVLLVWKGVDLANVVNGFDDVEVDAGGFDAIPLKKFYYSSNT